MLPQEFIVEIENYLDANDISLEDMSTRYEIDDRIFCSNTFKSSPFLSISFVTSFIFSLGLDPNKYKDFTKEEYKYGMIFYDFEILEVSSILR